MMARRDKIDWDGRKIERGVQEAGDDELWINSSRQISFAGDE